MDVGLRQYYLRARYYNPTAGQFGAPDQVDGNPTDPLSLHKYAYTQNNPVNMRDPSGNFSVVDLVLTVGIQNLLATVYNVGVAGIGSKQARQALVGGSSVNAIANEDALPDKDTATIIVHGVDGVGRHPDGWSKKFRADLAADNAPELPNTAPRPSSPSNPLNHDFYEFSWGGFSGFNFPIGIAPIRSVHQMAFVHLHIAQTLIWMKGYANMNVISHSWGTALSYDLLNSGGIEMKHWVTMGSPLKHSVGKPSSLTGSWINFWSDADPVVRLEMYPNNSRTIMIPGALFGPGLAANPNVDINRDKTTMTGTSNPFSITEHGAYWDNAEVKYEIRQYLQ